MNKKYGAALLLLMLTIVVGIFGSAAFAADEVTTVEQAATPDREGTQHHPILEVSAVCNPQTGNYDITHWLGNSETTTGSNKRMVLDQSSDSSVFPVGQTVWPQGSLNTPSGHVTAVKTVPGSTTGTYSYSMRADWLPDGPQNVGATDSVNLSGTCFSWDWTYEVTCSFMLVTWPANLPHPPLDAKVRIENLATGEEITIEWKAPDTGFPLGVPLLFIYIDHPAWPGWSWYRVEWSQVHGTNTHVEPNVECGSQPTATPVTPTNTPKTPTVEPTTEPTIEPTTEPTVELTTEPTVEPTATDYRTFVPLTSTPFSAITATPDYPDEFQGCRVGIGNKSDAEHLIGKRAVFNVLRDDGSHEQPPVLENLVKYEPGYASTEVFIEVTFSWMKGGKYAVTILDDDGNPMAIFTIIACGLVYDPPVEKPCPDCLPWYCEVLAEADVMVLVNEHPLTGELIYQVISTVEIDGAQQYITADGATMWILGDLRENPAAELRAAGLNVIEYFGVCSNCTIGWGTRRSQAGSFEVWWGFGSTVYDTTLAMADALRMSDEEYHYWYNYLFAQASGISVTWNTKRLFGEDSGWYVFSDPR